MSSVHDEMLRDLKRGGYAKRTVDIYMRSIEEFASFHARPIDELGPHDVRRWVDELQEQIDAHPARWAQHMAALKFLYTRTLDKPANVSFLRQRRGPTKETPVLLLKEVPRLFAAFRERRYRAFYQFLFGTGLRFSEARLIEVQDIWSTRSMIHVRPEIAKRQRERYVPLPQTLLELLRGYYREVRPALPWLFASCKGTPLDPGSTRSALKQAAAEAGIRIVMTPYVLRHTYATQMLAHGQDLRFVQTVLGHASIQSTVRYTHVLVEQIAASPSPLDFLNKV